MSSTNYAVFFIVLILMQHNGCYADADYKDNNKSSRDETVEGESDNGMWTFALKTAAVAVPVIVATPLVVAAAGFGTAGIAAGSLAAGVQAGWFGGAVTGMTGAAFGALQSIGAAGLGIGAKSAIVAGTGAIVKTYDYATGKKADDESSSGKPPDNNKNSWSLYTGWVQNYMNGV